MSDTVEIFKALADEMRLRLLRALEVAELSVAELVAVFDLPQSTVSRQLKPLRDCGLMEARRDGTSVYYHRGPVFDDPEFSALLNTRLAELPEAARDAAAVRQVLDQRRLRSRDFFDRMAGHYSDLTEPGGGWLALASALAVGFSGLRVADIGCGEGDLALLLARFATEVTAVDLSEPMLQVVRDRAVKLGLEGRIRLKRGDAGQLPLKDGVLDAVFMSQVLHHAAQPAAVLQEAARVLKSGGRLVLLDLTRHSQEWVREAWADQWLGFEEEEMTRWLKAAGFKKPRTVRLPGSAPDIAVLLMAAERG